VAELPACVERGHHHLERRLLFLRVNIDRNAAAVVLHGDGAVRVDGDVDFVAHPGKSLIDGVVDDFINQVVQGFDIRTPNIHAGAAPDGLEALQYLDILGSIR